MYQRNIKARVEAALKDTPVVFINGARQTGKTTLARSLVSSLDSAVYLTLDDAATLAAAAHDPVGFVRNLPGTTVIDEVQKAPALFPAIKVIVDRDRRPGRFLLTGSANVLLLPRLSESLVGRVEIISLWPLSQGELEGRRESFVDRTLSGGPFRTGEFTHSRPALDIRILRGGFPEAVRRADPGRRRDWYASYLSTLLQRDVRDLAHIEGLTDMPRLLSLLAARIGGLMNMSEVSRTSGIAHSTLKRYLALLETAFLIRPLPAWSANLGKRLVKSPKLYLCDTGLAAHLAGVQLEAQLRESPMRGGLFENFVLVELLKQMSWCDPPAALRHLRTSSGREVDFLLEWSDGRIAGIEVKCAATVHAADFAGLRELSITLGKKFACGVLLYGGDSAVPFGDRQWALPLSALWEV